MTIIVRTTQGDTPQAQTRLNREQEIDKLIRKAEEERGLCDVEHKKLSKLISEQEKGA